MGQNAQALFKTPEQVRAERLKQQQSMYASTQSPYERMGMAIGNILGTAFGVKDPALERASTAQSIYNSVIQSNPNTSSPEFYNTLAQQLSNAGLGAEAKFALEEGRKYQVQERELGLRERGVGIQEEQVDVQKRTAAVQEERLVLDSKKLEAELAKEERQGKFTEAQIRQINAQIANLGNAYEYQVLKGPAGETIGVLAINKKNPNDVRQIPLGATTAPTSPAAAGGATWNYVPGQGMVKAP